MLYKDFEKVFPGILEFDDILKSSKNYKVKTEDDSTKLYVPYPGLSKDNLKISIKEDILTIEIKKDVHDEWLNKKVQSFTVPSEIDASKAKASMENGILLITLPHSVDKNKITIL